MNRRITVLQTGALPLGYVTNYSVGCFSHAPYYITRIFVCQWYFQKNVKIMIPGVILSDFSVKVGSGREEKSLFHRM